MTVDELVAEHRAHIEAYDRDTRILATAEQAHTELGGDYG